MDPVTAMGLASAILTFVDIGFKFIRTANEIYHSTDGALSANRRIEEISDEAGQAAARVQSMAPSNSNEEQQMLFEAAQRCRNTSSELATILNKLKSNQSSRKRLETVKNTLKSIWNEGSIKKLENQLKEDRHQLTLTMSVFSRAEAADGFQKLFLLAKANETKLDSLTQASDNLRQAQLSMTDKEALSNFLMLLTVGSQARRAISQDRILDNIKFDEMCRRYEAVHVAHESTFNWIYENLDTVQAGDSFRPPDTFSHISNSAQMQFQSREMFINWLSSSDSSSPVFHISGKLGSGKSTLMKFLCCHPRTVQELNKWAGTDKLVFASFFSWRHGTDMQKSLAGLRRTLLYEVLEQRPDLLPDTLPDYWNKAEQTPGIAGINLDFPRALIEDAFNRLLQNPKLGDKHRFCFFIDGLDEFDPDCQDGEDYADMVGIFRQWTTHANGTLKLCVSSREDYVFLDEYRNYPGFRLQDLTRFDMQNYVRSRLSTLKNETLRNRFIHLIPKMSSGIFLWTYLVVRTIRNKISQRVGDDALEKYLKALPRGLKDLFRHVLDSLEDAGDRTGTLRKIRLLQIAKSKGLDFTLLASTLLEKYDKDPEIYMRDDSRLLRKDKEDLRAQLRGDCGGLIEHHPSYLYPDMDVLEFVHRSVPEMFQGNTKTNDLSIQMDEALRGTENVHTLIHLTFAVVRNMPPRNTLEAIRFIERMIPVLLEEKDYGPPYHFMEVFDTWIGNLFNRDALLAGSTWQMEDYNGYSHPLLFISHDQKPKQVFAHAIMMAINADRSDYIEWKIQQDAKTLGTPLGRAVVGWRLLMSQHWELFFHNDIFLCGSAVPLHPTQRNCPMILPLIRLGHIEQGFTGDLDPLTAWQFFLANAILSDDGQFRFEMREPNSEVIEQFLRQGFDPYCKIQITKAEIQVPVSNGKLQAPIPKDQGHTSFIRRYHTALKVVFRDVESNRSWIYSRNQRGLPNSWLQSILDKCHDLRGSPRLDFCTEFKEEYFLDEIIAATEWPNRDAILKIMKS